MFKMLVLGFPGHGHVNPTLPIMSALGERGVRVVYYNTEEFRAKIEATGVEFRPYPEAGLMSELLTKAVEVSLIAVTQILFEATLVLTEFVEREIERETPDVLMYDSNALWGRIAAQRTGLPGIASITTFIATANISFSIADVLSLLGNVIRRLSSLLRLRRAIIKRYGPQALPKGKIFPCRGDLTLVYTARDLQPDTPLINDTFRFVGPSLAPRHSDAPLDLPDTHPLVYISLGTLHRNDQTFFHACFEAFADYPATFLLSAGGQANALTPPANFIVRAHVPQLQVLAQADLFITHAGMNSLHESLYFGVPMVLVPQQMEQAINARIATEHGAGVVLADRPPYGSGVTAADLHHAVNRVLGDASYKAAAKKLKTTLHATGGTAQAVQEILSFAQERIAKPV